MSPSNNKDLEVKVYDHKGNFKTVKVDALEHILYILRPRLTLVDGVNDETGAERVHAVKKAKAAIEAITIPRTEHERLVVEARQEAVLAKVQEYDPVAQQTFFAGLFYRWCMAETNATDVKIKLQNFSHKGQIKGDLTIKATLTPNGASS